MARVRMSVVLIVVGLLWTSAAPADVLITPGDIGPCSPVMQHASRGLLLTNPESWVYSNTAFPYPSELIGASTLEVTIYFIPDSEVAGNVDFKLSVNTHNVGESYATPPYVSFDSPPPVPVSGSDTQIYSQTFTSTAIPTPRELMGVGIGRNVLGGPPDTYPTGIYVHALRIRDVSGTPVIERESAPILETHALRVSPNPFNAGTAIEYSLREPGSVTISIFDVQGRLADTIDQGFRSAGNHACEWRSSEAASGVYFVRLTVNGVETCSKMIKLD